MPNQIISTPAAPAAIGPYSQAVLCGSTLYCSGQVGIVPETGALAEGLDAQVRQAFSNLKAVIEAADGELADVAKLTLFLKSMDDFARVNEIMQEFFEAPFPARSCFAVAALPKGALFEAEAIVNLG